MRTFRIQLERTVTDVQQAEIDVEAETPSGAEWIAKQEALEGGVNWETTTPASDTSMPDVVSTTEK